MSTATERLPLSEAQSLAGELVALLRPVCERIEIAGSVRRKQETCGDIEIVCVPKLIGPENASDLFGFPVQINGLDELCHQMLVGGELDHRPDKNGHRAFGAKYKRLVYRGVALDLFSVIEPAQWGAVFLIRTGPADFSHRLVTPTNQGGWMPVWLQEKGGALRHRASGELVPTPEESDYFSAINRPFIPPEQRA